MRCAPADQLGELVEQLVVRVRLVRAEVRDRALDAGPVAGPGLDRAVARLDEQRVGGAAVGAQHRRRVRVVEAREVPEVAVLAERVLGVARARDQARAAEDRDRVGTHRIEHALAAFGEHAPEDTGEGVSIAIRARRHRRRSRRRSRWRTGARRAARAV